MVVVLDDLVFAETLQVQHRVLDAEEFQYPVVVAGPDILDIFEIVSHGGHLAVAEIFDVAEARDPCYLSRFLCKIQQHCHGTQLLQCEEAYYPAYGIGSAKSHTSAFLYTHIRQIHCHDLGAFVYLAPCPAAVTIHQDHLVAFHSGLALQQ